MQDDPDQPGHVYHSERLELTEGFQTISIGKSDFTKYPDWGTQDGEMNWSSVKNIQFQVGKKQEYNRYQGPYNDGVQGSITMLDLEGLIAWTGHRNYVGFSYVDILNLSDLKNIRITLKGSGSVDLRLEDGIENDPNATGHIYCSSSITLENDITTIVFDKYGFSKFPYAGLDGILNWDKIRKVQVQVSGTYSTVYLQSVIMELNNGTTYTINDGTVESSSVRVKSIKAFLSQGQTVENDGLKLISNAHGALHINPSYFMPFAYRKFAEIDPDSEGRQIWNSLVDASYSESEASLGVTLHDLDGNEIKGNGMLVPNWYMFDMLTGKRVDIATQKPGSNVRGYEFGYDAFRAIWYAAYDYSLSHDAKSKAFLDKAYPFFKNELVDRNTFYPVYKIDGTPVETYDAGAGFVATYLNLFNLNNDLENEKKTLDLLLSRKQASGDRTWFGDPQNASEGGEEYYMNFWGLFGLWLYFQNNAPDIDNDKIVDLKDAIAGLQVLSGLNMNGLANRDINCDNRIGMEEVIFILRKISGLQ